MWMYIAIALLVLASYLPMADAKSNYLEDKLLDHALGKGTRNFTSPANLYVALHTSNPGETGATGEVSGNNYSRQAVTFGAASSGSAQNTVAMTFLCSGGNWGTITHASIWDASSAGNCLYYGALTTSRTINNGDELEIAIGGLTVSEL